MHKKFNRRLLLYQINSSVVVYSIRNRLLYTCTHFFKTPTAKGLSYLKQNTKNHASSTYYIIKHFPTYSKYCNELSPFF